jgi:hypothetical protein
MEYLILQRSLAVQASILPSQRSPGNISPQYSLNAVWSEIRSTLGFPIRLADRAICRIYAVQPSEVGTRITWMDFCGVEAPLCTETLSKSCFIGCVEMLAIMLQDVGLDTQLATTREPSQDELRPIELDAC